VPSDRSAADTSRAGLCATCEHVNRVVSSKGSIFYLCRLSDTDPRFRKYPALPVIACIGYTARRSDDSDE
jgi:hypothetical protein